MQIVWIQFFDLSIDFFYYLNILIVEGEADFESTEAGSTIAARRSTTHSSVCPQSGKFEGSNSEVGIGAFVQCRRHHQV